MLEERCDTLALDGLGTQAVVGWAGLLLQRTPDAVCSQRSVAGRGVYASYRFFGSPAARYDISPTVHVTALDSVPTPDLSTFLAEAQLRRDGDVVRVKFTDLEGRHRLTTLKLDLQYWPTFTLESDAAGEWVRTMHPAQL